MSEYITGTYGPGEIAALPPTIGSGDSGPTIGSEDAGHRIKQAFPFMPHYMPGAAQVEAAGMKLPMNGLFGLGTNGNGNGGGIPGWALPIGIGLVLGGLYVMFSKKREHRGILQNSGRRRAELIPSGAFWYVVEPPPMSERPVFGIVTQEGSRFSGYPAPPPGEKYRQHEVSKRFRTPEEAADYVLRLGSPNKTVGQLSAGSLKRGEEEMEGLLPNMDDEPTCNDCGY